MEPITVRKESSQPAGESKKGSKRPAWLKKLWPKLVVGLVLLAAIGAAAYYYTQYRDVRDNPTQAVAQRNNEETTRVLTKLKSVLRIDETDAPTVARVDDPAKLKATNEEFYRNVEKGDYLVLYPKRAILFREANSQIINVAPIINTSELQPAQNDGDESDEQTAQ